MPHEKPNYAFQVQYPPLQLAPYVHHISAYQERIDTMPDEEQTPTAWLLPMIIVLDSGWDYSIKGQRYAFGESFMAGLCTTPVLTHSRGFASCMQVNFTPAGARRFLGVDMYELRDNLVPLNDLLGIRGRKLASTLRGLNNWNDRFGHVYRILIDQILGKRGARQMSTAVSHALHIIQSHAALERVYSVNDIAAAVGISRKHLTHLFTGEVGIPPGQFLKLCRFENALSLLRRKPALDFTEIAMRAGYADQAHFSRSFSHYMGRPPSTYRTGRQQNG
ncbi:MAG: helix-turn-helix domain-containing protein [Pseudomonadota bacterium]